MNEPKSNLGFNVPLYKSHQSSVHSCEFNPFFQIRMVSYLLFIGSINHFILFLSAVSLLSEVSILQYNLKTIVNHKYKFNNELHYPQ